MKLIGLQHAWTAIIAISQPDLANSVRAPFLQGREVGSQQSSVLVSRLGDGTPQGHLLLPVKLGGQVLHVVADTGSFGLVVSSTRCSASKCPKRAFSFSDSTTYEALNETRDLKYLAGKVDLALASDELELDGQRKRQKFWEILGMEDLMVELWKSAAFEGVLGLPWTAKVPGKDEDSLNETTVTEAFGIQAFTVCLGRRTMVPQNGSWEVAPSYIYWGEPGAVRWPSMSYVQNIGRHHWAVSLSTVSVRHRDDGKYRRFSCFGEEKCAALLDTGTRMMTLPTQHLNGLLAQLGGMPAEDCSNYDRLPDIHFQLGDVNITLPRAAYIKRHRLKVPSLKNSKDMCVFRFQTQDVDLDGTPLWILGVPFFQEYVVEYDRSRSPPRMGLAQNPGAQAAGGDGQCPETPDVAGSTSATSNTNPAASRAGLVATDVTLLEPPDEDAAPDVLHLLGLGSSPGLLSKAV